MNRPLFLRLLPDRLRMSAWARLYRPTSECWHVLYQGAPLRFAKHVSMDLLPGDVISDSIAFTGIYELARTRRLVGIARQGGTMIDIGANLGYFSLLWAAGASGNRCLAFEPSPRVVEMLTRNVTGNGLASQVQVFPKAAGRQAGSLSFDVGPAEQSGWGGLVVSPGRDGIRVDVVRCDEVVPQADDIALLKIDVEGADTWALMGCERLFRARRIKQVWFEQNRPRMRRLDIGEDEAENFLQSVGYRAQPESDPSEELVEWSAFPA
jgi:FkbM family methyltransferase